jgi:hypothetical protein
LPTKLLIELASLSGHKFRVELKSKLQTLVLPLPSKEEKNDEHHDRVAHRNSAVVPRSFGGKSAHEDLLSSHHAASLDKNFITLTCTIVSNSVALVPPIRVLLPYSYPEANPFVDCKQLYDNDDDMLPGYGE